MNLLKKISLTVAVVILCTFLCSLAGCGTEENNVDGIKIVCSVFPQYDICRVIVGGDENVVLLQKNGTDMHSYEPTSKDILEIAKCDLLVYTGGSSDGWVERVVKASQNEKMKAVSLFEYCTLIPEETEGISEGEHDNHDHNHGEEIIYDEHVWMSISNVKKIATGLTDEICRIDPENEKKYRENCKNYIVQLEMLDEDFREVCADERMVVADRFPFLYFAKEYDIDYCAAFPGCSSESEASFETVLKLIDKTKQYGLRYIFKTDDSTGDVARAVAESTGAEVKTLYSCQSITDEQLKNGESYLSLMRANLEVLKMAFKASDK